MKALRIATLQAPNQESIVEQVSKYLENELKLPTRYIRGIPWQESERLLDRGEIELAWLCGLPYIQKVDQAKLEIELLAAPVMRNKRYRNKPIYFSDVIVRVGSRFRQFRELRGARWAYNEPNSHSGFNLTRYYLAKYGETGKFFGEVTEAGSHENAIVLVLNGSVDGSAIDSTVLEIELARDPGLARKIRVIDTFGPSPIPPWVIHKSVPFEIRKSIQEAMTSMHKNPAGKKILTKAQVKRFDAVIDRDYDLIREMARVAASIQF
jgi:phosphonate transport system substrate-binding protein